MDARTLADSLLHATAQQDAAKATTDAYREALTDAFRTLWESGIKAEVPIAGVGKAEWRTYKPAARIRDYRAFMEWAGYLTTTRITIPTARLLEVRELLLDADIDFSDETILRDGDRDAVLARLTPTDDGQAVTDDGELVPGVAFETQAPNLYVTVDSGLKTEQRRRAREAVIAEVAAE